MRIRIGDMVDYHSVIGGPVTSTGHMVETIYPKPNNYGRDVAKISNKSGVVSISALTLTEKKEI